jgi:hypothetical protein
MRINFAWIAAGLLCGCTMVPHYSASSDERPGLGTRWGEGRESRVRPVSFDRAAEAPDALVALHYDDRAGASALAGPGAAAERARVTLRRGVEVEVVDERGRALSMLSGDRRCVVGAPGDRYALRIRNATGARFEVVASVDGLDVLDGLAASFGKRGYLVEPFGELTIDGFRKSSWEVAAFRFGSVAESYAARSGSDRDVGVIGVALFADAADRALEAERRLRADPFPGRFARSPDAFAR